jgi:hypothetical protein
MKRCARLSSHTHWHVLLWRLACGLFSCQANTSGHLSSLELPLCLFLSMRPLGVRGRAGRAANHTFYLMSTSQLVCHDIDSIMPWKSLERLPQVKGILLLPARPLNVSQTTTTQRRHISPSVPGTSVRDCSYSFSTDKRRAGFVWDAGSHLVLRRDQDRKWLK